jgi:hypothetical protein
MAWIVNDKATREKKKNIKKKTRPATESSEACERRAPVGQDASDEIVGSRQAADPA